MPITKKIIISATIAVLSIVSMLPVPLYHPGAALADPARLSWSIVDTPDRQPSDNTVISPSEVNSFAVSGDEVTLYATDIPNQRVYKSVDNGASWPAYNQLDDELVADGANLPVWNIALAPDDPAIIIAITDGNGVPNGPKSAFISINGGNTWYNGNLTIAAGEYVSSIDISPSYGGQGRDVVIGTRNGAGTGRVLILKLDNFAAGWQDQALAPAGDVIALKFSPNYTADSTIVVTYADAAVGGTFLITGTHDLVNNTTAWGTANEIRPAGSPIGSSPDATQIITADLELPINYVGTNPATRHYYFCNDDANVTGYAGVYRIDDTQSYFISPPVTARFSSIAYWGTWEEGEMAVGEATTDPTTPFVTVWRCADPVSNAPTWLKSDDQKSPTGGANTGYANAQLAWSPAGNRLYCATSSADLSTGGTSWFANHWPRALLTTVALDESAFSISPYTRFYEFNRVRAEKPLDLDTGLLWNQTGLIDTEISLLSDIAALEAPPDSLDYPVRYLASINDTIPEDQNYDSVWRSTTDRVDRTWERILCVATASDYTLLRLNPRVDESNRSEVLAFAERTTKNLRFSIDEGQSWKVLYPNLEIVDLSLASDLSLYVLSGLSLRRGEQVDNIWQWGPEVSTTMDSGHTIATPLENREYPDKPGEFEDWVVIGSQVDGYIVYADFSKPGITFNPPPIQRVAAPVPGNMHVIFDDEFEETRIIYAASNDLATGTLGKVYRWTAGESTAWDELEPPSNAFYGLAQGNGVLYGVWDEPAIPGIQPGVDRTLYPLAPVPPPIEWDDLTVGLPDVNIAFTREPTALKISVGQYNTLWAIDNRDFDPVNSEGCLWAYTDTMAVVGPWSTAPPSGDLIPVDPVSGRATEVNFVWEQVDFATGYELQIAKDEGFTIQILSSDNITPVDQTAPAAFFPAGGLSPTPASAVGTWGNLESGHDYYWRVRASRAVTGEVIRSPWSATMFFTVKAGLETIAKVVGLTQLKPRNGEANVTLTPSFSWAPLPRTSEYEIIIAEDPALDNYIVKEKVKGTAYEYDNTLKPNRVYFWQVRALEPSPSEPSPVATFTTITIEEEPEDITPQKTKLPFWIWPVIAVYSLLIAAMIVFAYMRPSLFEPASKRAGKSAPKSRGEPPLDYTGRPAPGRPVKPTSGFVGRPATGQPVKPPPPESVIELPAAQPPGEVPEQFSEPTFTQSSGYSAVPPYPQRPEEYAAGPTPVQPQERFVPPPPVQPVEPPQEQFTAQYQYFEQPKQAGEPKPIIEKIKSPFIRIAESLSPKYRQRRYLEELEDKGIIEPMQQYTDEIPIDETRGESFGARLKNTLLSRFRKKENPEDEGDYE